jgi:3-methyl-2-oxobutanoate hydroxymethyltransferase
VLDLPAWKEAGRRLVVLTCYDAAFARLLDRAEVDILLVGDSLNQVIAGQETTLSATLDQMIYHAAAVRRGAPGSLMFVDLPFLTYQVSIPEAIRNAGTVLQETEANGVKLEGGRHMAETVQALVERGIPVMGHLGLTPQWCTPWVGIGSRAVRRRPPTGCSRTRGRWRRPEPARSSWS